jgi:hypothetical protein
MVYLSNLTLLYQTSSATLLSQESLGVVKGNTNQGTASAQLASSESLATDTTSTLVSLDPATLGAIAKAAAPFYDTRPAFAQPNSTGLLTDLSSALSQGNGAFFVSYNVNGAGFLGSFTPAEFAKLRDGDDKPIDGLPIANAIQAAETGGWQIAGSEQAAAPQDPRLQDELKALVILNKGTGSASATRQTTAQLVNPSTTALTVQASGTEDGHAVSISIVWVPPSDAATVQTQTSAVSTSAQSLTLNSLA